ncbi:hypothetical protein MUP01_04885 [Candidatus Bathyarchaeota archaeon]|nr:hypothetical protein [Candidatus Bathyarchaeota archaeon]
MTTVDCCPNCGSTLLYKDGLRYTNTESLQRWLCRNCGHRFSDKKPPQKSLYCHINTANTIASSSQVCDLLTEESKNLALTENPPENRLAGATTTPHRHQPERQDR